MIQLSYCWGSLSFKATDGSLTQYVLCKPCQFGTGFAKKCLRELVGYFPIVESSNKLNKSRQAEDLESLYADFYGAPK